MIHDLVFLFFVLVPVGLIVVPLVIGRRRRSEARLHNTSESPTC